MIWITQWLCPERHCSIGLSWDDTQTNSQEVERKGEELFQSGAINRWCGICNGTLHVEHGQTAFQTMEEAMPSLIAHQQANENARRILQNKN